MTDPEPTVEELPPGVALMRDPVLGQTCQVTLLAFDQLYAHLGYVLVGDRPDPVAPLRPPALPPPIPT